MKHLTDLELYDLMSDFVFEALYDAVFDEEIRLFIRGYDYFDFIQMIPIDSERPLDCCIVSDGNICICLSEFESMIDDFDTFEKMVKKNMCGKEVINDYE